MLGESFVRRGKEILFGSRSAEGGKEGEVFKKIREAGEGVLYQYGGVNRLGHSYFLERIKINGGREWVGLYAPHGDPQKATYVACKVMGEEEEIRFYREEPRMAIGDVEYPVLDPNRIGRYATRIFQMRKNNPPVSEY